MKGTILNFMERITFEEVTPFVKFDHDVKNDLAKLLDEMISDANIEIFNGLHHNQESLGIMLLPNYEILFYDNNKVVFPNGKEVLYYDKENNKVLTEEVLENYDEFLRSHKHELYKNIEEEIEMLEEEIGYVNPTYRLIKKHHIIKIKYNKNLHIPEDFLYDYDENQEYSFIRYRGYIIPVTMVSYEDDNKTIKEVFVQHNLMY